MEDLTSILTGLLKQHHTLKLATTGGKVSPWIAGAFFAESDPFTLQLVLEEHGKTLANILADNRVAVIVAGESPFALFAQGQGTASVVEGAAAERVRADLLAKAPEIQPFLAAPLKAVHIKLERWLLTDVPKGWLPARELKPAQ